MRVLFLIFICLSASAADFGKTLKPFINKYCIDCHGPKKEKGDLRLDTLSTEITDLKVAENWQHVLDELNGATMPPEDEKQANSKELSAVLEVLTYELELAKKKLYGKDREIVMRKLNKREYINTIYDLTGVNLPELDVPDDNSSSSFDTNGKGLFLSAYQLKKYRSLAEKALHYAIQDNAKPFKVTSKPELKRSLAKVLKKAAGDDKQKDKKKDKNKKTKTSKDSTKSKELIQKETARVKWFMNHPATKAGFTILGGSTSKKAALNYLSEGFLKVFEDNFQAGVYTFKIYGGTIDAQAGDLVQFALVSKDKNSLEVLSTFEFTQDYKNPQVHEFSIILENQTDYLLQSKIVPASSKSTPFAAIKEVKVSGPISTTSRSKVFPFSQAGLSERDYAGKVIAQFTQKAFRNEAPTEKFKNVLLNYFELNRNNGMSVNKALEGPLAVVLSSPKFLYRAEKNSKWINSTELANRLSYFLWSTQPDATLLNLAKSGQLEKADVLKSQVHRMIRDEKFLNLAKGFVPQWLGMHKLKEVDVNRKKFKGFTSEVRHDIELETIHFFHTLSAKNLSIENFIDSNFVVVNNNLKSYYKLPGKALDGFQPLKLPANSERGGLLGQASLLVMTGNGERTSPVMRGAFILSKMLGMPSPEPPPNVPQLENEKTKGLSVKEALLVHQEQPQCSSCHKRIDPAGFGLENFDAAGLLRSSKKGKKSSESETAGKLPGGHSFANYKEMKELLMKRKDKFTESLTEALMGYAFGREIGFSDAKLVDQLVSKTVNDNYKLGNLITNIILSPEFRQK